MKFPPSRIGISPTSSILTDQSNLNFPLICPTSPGSLFSAFTPPPLFLNPFFSLLAARSSIGDDHCFLRIPTPNQHSSGRGGLGNITRTKSKSREPGAERDREQQVHSIGRGGRGNIVPDIISPSVPEADESTAQA